MLKIPLNLIELYSKCPKKYEYSESRPQEIFVDKKRELFKRIVTGAYLNKTRTGSFSPWRVVSGLIDRYCFDGIDVSVEKDTNLAFDKSIKLINIVRRDWYQKYYLEEEYLEGFPDMKLAVQIDSEAQVYDTADLILYSNKDLILCSFSSVELSSSVIYNSIRLRSQALLLGKLLKRPITKIRSLTWKQDDNLSIRDLRIHEPDLFTDKTEKALLQMTRGIINKTFYPSVNEQCITCPFRSICSF